MPSFIKVQIPDEQRTLFVNIPITAQEADRLIGGRPRTTVPMVVRMKDSLKGERTPANENYADLIAAAIVESFTTKTPRAVIIDASGQIPSTFDAGNKAENTKTAKRP